MNGLCESGRVYSKSAVVVSIILYCLALFQSVEVCDSPDSSDGSTQVSSQVVVTSPTSEPHTPHYIVAGTIYFL